MIMDIGGMTCEHCQKAVERALKAVSGVESVEVNLQEGWARIEGEAEPAQLLEAVSEEGYQPRMRT